MDEHETLVLDPTNSIINKDDRHLLKPTRWRCDKGHVTEGTLRIFVEGSHVEFCPYCIAALLTDRIGITTKIEGDA